MSCKKLIINKRGGGNSLNTIRLLAAFEVMYDHTREHLYLEMPELLNSIVHFFAGVPIFFMLSGFLIWQSVGRSNSYNEYLRKRFWRIYPELWVAVVVEIVAIILLYDQPINYPLLGLFTIGQATFFQFWTPNFLRGYGCGCPNGALWTICVLIQFYALAYSIYKFLHGKSAIRWVVCIVISLIISLFTPSIQTAMSETVGKLYGITIIQYLWMFLLAAFAAEKKDNILPLLKKAWPLLVLSILIIRYLHCDIRAGYNVIDSVMLFCGLLGMAYAIPQINIKTDISYGVYIYHMTVVNALIALGYLGENWLMIFVVVGTLLLAYVSTITVGKWSLSKKYNKNQ